MNQNHPYIHTYIYIYACFSPIYQQRCPSKCLLFNVSPYLSDAILYRTPGEECCKSKSLETRWSVYSVLIMHFTALFFLKAWSCNPTDLTDEKAKSSASFNRNSNPFSVKSPLGDWTWQLYFFNKEFKSRSQRLKNVISPFWGS